MKALHFCVTKLLYQIFLYEIFLIPLNNQAYSQINNHEIAKKVFITGINSLDFFKSYLPGYTIDTSYIIAFSVGKHYALHTSSIGYLIFTTVYGDESIAAKAYQQRLMIPQQMPNREINIAGDESVSWGRGTVFKAGKPAGLGESYIVFRRNNVVVGINGPFVEELKSCANQIDQGLLNGSEKQGVFRGQKVPQPELKENPFTSNLKLNEKYRGHLSIVDPNYRQVQHYIRSSFINIIQKDGSELSMDVEFLPKRKGYHKIYLYLLNDLNVLNHVELGVNVE